MRILTNGEVTQRVSPADALEAVRNAFAELANGTAAVQRRVRTAAGNAKLSTLGAVISRRGYLGGKVYSTVDGRFTFVVILFDATDGRLLAVLESDALTRLRTAATSVLSTELFYDGTPRELVVFGSGAQATGHAEAFAARYPLDRITMVTRSARPEVVTSLQASLHIPVRPVSPRHAAPTVAEADVIVTATRSTTPVIAGQWLRPGAHLCAVGVSHPEARELDDDVYRRAAPVCVEWRAQARHEAGGLVGAIDDGVLSWDEVVELSEVLAEPDRLRRESGDLSVFQSVGIGLEDVAVAVAAWEACTDSRTV